MAKLLALFWPVTRRKVHRLVHLAGVGVTLWLVVYAYRLTAAMPLTERIPSLMIPLVPLFTRWQALFHWVDDNVVDKLDLPDDPPKDAA